ncbi:MAG: prepilin-type N-terminal cleavage/methylation domain-containing protein [Nitrospira sp.]|nr:prepilin-type N-terminal cleavage/methylation domain-containing protein [Nitrospira sp.]
MKGFTFIEVILALTLFSFGLLAITGMFGVSTQALQSGGDRTKAVLLAQEKLEELKDLPYHHIMFTPNDQGPADRLHTAREDHGPIQLSWSVEKDRPMAGLSVLTVQAIWRASGGQVKSVKFVTLRTDLGDGPASGLAQAVLQASPERGGCGACEDLSEANRIGPSSDNNEGE